MSKLKPYVGWIVVALLVIFVILNLEEVRISVFHLVKLNMPLGLVVILSAAVGAGAALAFQAFRKRPPKA